MQKTRRLTIALFLFSSSVYSQGFKIIENTYKLRLNKSQGAISTTLIYDEHKNELLRSVQKPNNQIEVFDLHSGFLKKTIPLKVNLLGSFSKISDNLFWIHDPIIRTYFLVNGNGNIQKKIKEPSYSKDLVYIHTSSYPYAPIIYHKNSLFVSGRIMFKDIKNIQPSIYKTTGIIEKLSLDGKTGFIGNPTEKAINNFYGNMTAYSITINKNTLICSPHFSDELLLINLDNNKTQFIRLKTKYEKLIVPISSIKDAKNYSNFQRNEYFKYSYTNIGFVYDKYKDLYYRFVRFPLKTPGAMECAILVFDRNFKLLFEEKVDHKKYNVSKFFITKKGLAILNIEKYKRNDSLLIFDIFTSN